MIEVIQHGDKKEKQYTVTCQMCGTLFKFGLSDAKQEFFRNEILLTCLCPICNHPVKTGG